MKSRAILIATVLLMIASSWGSTLAQQGPAAPGLGQTDGWVDAAGDQMFGTLVMGGQSIRFLDGNLGDPPGPGSLTFAGEALCLAHQDIAGCGSVENIVAGSGLFAQRSEGIVTLDIDSATVCTAGVMTPGCVSVENIVVGSGLVADRFEGTIELNIDPTNICTAGVPTAGCGSVESITVGDGLGIERTGGSVHVFLATDPSPVPPLVWSGFCSAPSPGTGVWTRYCLDRQQFSTFGDDLLVEADGTIHVLLPGIYRVHVQGRAQPLNGIVGVQVLVNGVVAHDASETTNHQHNHVSSDLLWQFQAGDRVTAAFFNSVWEGPLYSRLQVEYVGPSPG